MTTNRIRQLRQARGLSQGELGALIGADKHKVSRIESGRQKLDLDLAKRLSRVLDVSLAEVLDVTPTRDGSISEAAPYDPDRDDPLARLVDPQRKRVLYRAEAGVLDEIGIRAGDIVLVDLSDAAVSAVKDLAVVLAELPEGNARGPTLLLRQFVPPGLLTTNSRTDNRAPVSLAATGARIVGVVVSWHRQM